MTEGLKALKSLEKIVSKLYGMDIAYDEKTFNLFCAIGKELNALKIIKKYIKLEGTALYLISYIWELPQEENELLKEVLK